MIASLILRTVATLEASGHWTRVLHLHFPQPQYPVARIEFGAILSDGSHERAIGMASVFADGKVVRSYHL